MSQNEKPIIVQSEDTLWGEPRFVGTRLGLVFIIEYLQSNTVKELIETWPYMRDYQELLLNISKAVMARRPPCRTKTGK